MSMLNFALKYPNKKEKGDLPLSRRQSKSGARGSMDVAAKRTGRRPLMVMELFCLH